MQFLEVSHEDFTINFLFHQVDDINSYSSLERLLQDPYEFSEEVQVPVENSPEVSFNALNE